MNDIDIKEIRVNLGISQEKLAEMVGVSPRTVQNWESGSKIPNSKHAILRSLLLKDTPQYAGGGEEIKKTGNLIPFYDNVTSIGGVNELGAEMDGGNP